jgi:ABC-type tungstate transport system substrate-binding protein
MVPIGHITHQALCLNIKARTMAMIVVMRHMLTNIAPIAIKLPPEFIILYAKNDIRITKTIHLNHIFEKRFGEAFLGLILDIPMSKKAPLGHRFQHQYRPLKTIMAERKPSLLPPDIQLLDKIAHLLLLKAGTKPL